MTLVKIVHLLAWILLFTSSIQKNRLISSPSLDESVVMRMRKWDKVSGAMSGVMLLSGLGMLFWWAKPTSYYLGSTWFAIKMAFFCGGKHLDCLDQDLDEACTARSAMASVGARFG